MSHTALVSRSGELEILTSCSCGAWLIARADDAGDVIVSWRFNRMCPATDLAWTRLKAAP